MKKKFNNKLLIFLRSLMGFFVCCIFVPSLQAKDLTSRLGVGYSNQFSEDLPSLSVRYHPSQNLGITAALGVDTQKDQSKFGFMARIYKILFHEDNMHFYMGSGAGLLSREQNGQNDSGFELTGFAGGEFFFTGLDSLGFSFEMGVGVTSISSEVRFRTIGESPFKAGITFYF